MSKNGRKPLAAKKTVASLTHDDIFGNAMTLPPELKAELDEQGLEPRFVDFKKLKEMDGFHEKGWTVYKKEDSDIIGNNEFRFGSTPDGVVRRGSMVLAVKPKASAEKHRAYLRQKAQRYSKSFVKRTTDELRQIARDGNVDARIYEGYEDNE